MLRIPRPKKRMAAALAVLAMGLFATAALLAMPGASGQVEIRVINGSDGILPLVEIETPEGTREYRDIPAGASRSFALPAASTSLVRFRWEGADGVNRARFLGRPSGGAETLRIIELRYTPGHSEVTPILGADFPTRFHYAVAAIRHRLGL